MREILDELGRLLQERDGGALVTITRTTGSTYRREGAKDAVPQGRQRGGVGERGLPGRVSPKFHSRWSSRIGLRS